MKCPECGSNGPWLETLIGWSGEPQDDPNVTTCIRCRWSIKNRDLWKQRQAAKTEHREAAGEQPAPREPAQPPIP